MDFSNATLTEITDKMNDRVFLPGLQRDIVWEKDQIKKLFDSIIEGYPVGSIIVWEKDNLSKEEVLYEFMEHYSLSRTTTQKFQNQLEASEFNENVLQRTQEKDEEEVKTIAKNLEDFGSIFLILDGQQRLSALNIGLNGSVSEKNSKNDWVFNKKLYINISSKVENPSASEPRNDLKFLDEDEDVIFKSGEAWLRLGVLTSHERGGLISKIHNECEENGVEYDVQYVNDIITLFNDKTGILKVEKITSDKSDSQVLESFIRVNKEGTELNESDFLLSVLTNSWSDEGVNAKEQINQFIEYIDLNLDYEYSLTPKNVLDALAQCLDMGHEYEVEEFTEENRIEKAKNIWKPEKEVYEGKLQQAIIKTLKLADKLKIPPTNRVFGAFTVNLPIIYYFYNSDYEDFEAVPEKEIRKIEFFMYTAYLGDKYSRRYENLADDYQDTIKPADTFPIWNLNQKNKELIGEALIPSEPRIREALSKTDVKNSTLAFGLFRLIYYPVNLDTIQFMERDHIYPKDKYTYEKLDKHNYDEYTITELLKKKDSLANSQLLLGEQNNDKGDTNPHVWFRKQNKDELKRHIIPDSPDANWGNIEEFFEEREEQIVKNILSRYDEEYLAELNED